MGGSEQAHRVRRPVGVLFDDRGKGILFYAVKPSQWNGGFYFAQRIAIRIPTRINEDEHSGFWGEFLAEVWGWVVGDYGLRSDFDFDL